MFFRSPGMKKTVTSSGEVKDVDTSVVGGFRAYARFCDPSRPSPRPLRGHQTLVVLDRPGVFSDSRPGSIRT